MCMYSAKEDGKVTDWHMVHYGTHAAGTVGLLMLESTDVECRGPITWVDGRWADRKVAEPEHMSKMGAILGVFFVSSVQKIKNHS